MKKDGYVRYHDIGDYLSREEKLSIVEQFGDILKIDWSYITPNDNNDWLNQRNQSYINFIALGDKKKQEKTSVYFDNYASGLSTSRDSWVYSFSSAKAMKLSHEMIDFNNAKRERYFAELREQRQQGIISVDDKKASDTFLTNIRSNDATRISWSAGLSTAFCRDCPIEIIDCIRTTSYRPFCKKYLVYNKDIIERPSKWDSILPNDSYENVIMSIAGAPIKKNFSVFITRDIQNLHFMEISICFPMYMYDKVEKNDNGDQMTLFDTPVEDTPTYKKRYAISDAALTKFKGIYADRITKEDYLVSKMRFKKDGKDNDKGTIIFNDYITISNIPERAYEYVVNGRSAIEWIMESYRVKTDKDSGITDDPNTYGDEKYIFNLLISVISVSLKTLDLIDSMPEYKEI